MAAVIMVHRVRFLVSVSIAVMLLQACIPSKTKSAMPEFDMAKINVQMQNGLLTRDNEPFTGIIYSLQANKKDTAEIVCFNQGREHGVWKKFYPDGGLMEQRSFDNGKKTGDYIALWPNRAQKLAYHFADGEYNGTCREWTANGQLVAEMNYKNGYENGPQKQFYNNGKIKANYIITDGRRYGLLGTKNCVNVADSVFKK